MKIDGRLVIVLTMVLTMIPGACAVSIGGGASVSTDGSGSAQGNSIATADQVIGYSIVKSGDINEDHWIEDTTGKRAEVKATVVKAKPNTINFDYYLSMGKNKDKMDCTPDSRQLVKQRYLKQTPLRTVLEIYSQELNAASSCCTPSQ